jgi:hypothetical protein
MKKPHFSEIQTQFAAHIRLPEQAALPHGIEDRRMKIYRELVYNNIEDFLNSGFPIIRQMFSDQDWHLLVRDFVSTHRSSTPYFLEIGAEFLAFLDSERGDCDAAQSAQFNRQSDPPFLLQLAQYEWAELALYVADDEIPDDINASLDLFEQLPVLSPLAWSMVFNYPVHQIGPDNRPESPSEQPHCLVVYRNREDKVAFLEANVVTARLLELCEDNHQFSGRELLEQIAREMSVADSQTILAGGRETLAQLRSLDIIFGKLSEAP